MKTDTDLALEWWTSGRMKLCQHDARAKYYPNNACLTEKEIEEVWRQENSSELKSLQLNSLFAEREKIEDEIFKIDNMALINYELEQLQK